MKTAIVVSGVMRHMINASSSWFIPGDYYLHVDNNVVEPQSWNVLGSASQEIHDALEKSQVKFTTVTIDIDNRAKYTAVQKEKYFQIDKHATLNMLWRWKCVFNQLKLFQPAKQYDSVLLLRPDIYLFSPVSAETFDKMELAPGTIYSTAGITPGDFDWRGYPTMNDCLLLMDFNTMEKFSKAYDFYIEHYEDTLYRNYDVHSMLARFVIEQNIQVDGRLSELLSFAILRENTSTLFDHGRLRPEYGFHDLIIKQQEWWNAKWNLKN